MPVNIDAATLLLLNPEYIPVSKTTDVYFDSSFLMHDFKNLKSCVPYFGPNLSFKAIIFTTFFARMSL
jgi:hypothetical protein